MSPAGRQQEHQGTNSRNVTLIETLVFAPSTRWRDHSKFLKAPVIESLEYLLMLRVMNKVKAQRSCGQIHFSLVSCFLAITFDKKKC